MKTATKFFFGSIFIGFIFFANESCKKSDSLPDNPFSHIQRTDSTLNGIFVDSLTITYLHTKVLLTRCALPGCHVGNFEPDFRTPQSSFSTMVYAAIKKNNAANTYTYRVIPYDTAHSVLWARVTNCCFVNNNDRMPQDNIGIPLPDSSIHQIQKWIMNGARDMFGNVASLPNAEPTISGFAALSSDYQITYSNNRLDSVPYNPFIVPLSATSFFIGIAVSDDSTAKNQMQFNKLKISTNADDFSSASVYQATYLSAFAAWVVSVPAGTLPQSDTLFMRYYVNDGSHVNNTEFPRNDIMFPYKTYWSFIRQ